MYLRHGPVGRGHWTAHSVRSRTSVMRTYRWLRRKESRAHARFVVAVMAEAFSPGIGVRKEEA